MMQTSSHPRREIQGLLLLALPLLLVLAPSARAEHPNQGFLYGKVTTESGTEYEGILRWGREEAFWDDLFNSVKEEVPWQEELEDLADRDRRERRQSSIKILGYRIQWKTDGWGASRQFIARFGDIRSIRVTADEDADILMKSGETYAVSGYANDVGGTIHVVDASLGAIDLKWDRVETIEFLPTPRDVQPGAKRLYGTVHTGGGDFSGYIQWDSEECLTTDILDGESEDGDLEIEMGRIKSIERRGRRSSLLELEDGRTLRLRGTNDVDSSIRGILVEDERFGRAKVGWDGFDRVEFRDAPGSGRGYEDYPDGRPLRGVVVDMDGREYGGRIIFDVDEAESWEMLNGSWDDVEYNIPFANIARIRPVGGDESVVVLHNGTELHLEDGQDVSDRNDGILVYPDEGEPVHVRWDDLQELRLER